MTPDPIPLTPDEAESCAAAAARIVEALETVVLGQAAAVRESVAALLARGHVLLEGVPGTAKTLLVRSLSRALGLEFRRIQFTPDLMPSDITGVNLLDQSGRLHAPAGPGVRRSRPRRRDQSRARQDPGGAARSDAGAACHGRRRVASAAGGRSPSSRRRTRSSTRAPTRCPRPQLDRFIVKVLVGYPAEHVEQGILDRVLGGFESDLPASYGIGPVAGAGELARLRDGVRRVRVERSIIAYITAIVRATRGAPVLTLGASPRGSVSLLKMAQASALLDGRAYVVPDDVKSLATAVLRHRVAVAPELELEGITADAALDGVIQKIEAPR